ncbi:CpaF family protein [Myxococcota bacterium]
MTTDMYEQSVKEFFKPVRHFLEDASVSEIMINGPEDIWIERKGKLYRTDAKFTPEGLEAAARNVAQYVGRIITDERPRLDARLPDGSRIHVVLPPIARKGTAIAIRKFFPGSLTVPQLIGFGALTPEWARFVDACVKTSQNVIVAGGTGSGKTTLLNVVSSLIPNEERILTIEDSAELQLLQDHLVAFESRPPDKLGHGAVTIAHLLHSSLRLRPDRIVIGEVRGGEAFDLMQAMNTGHSGSMCTVHANSPTETCRRLESLCLMSEIELPMVAIRAQIAAALNIIICCARFHDGSRRLTHIAEVLPLNEKGDYRTQDLFVYTVTGKDDQGKILGYHAPTGILPTFMDKLEAYGYPEMDESFFDPATYGLERPPVTGVKEFKVQWTSRLKDGVEQSKPKPLDSERKETLTRALNEVYEERDKVPPPTAKHEPPDSPGGEASGSPAKAAKAAPKEEAKPRKAGAYARELLKKTTTNSGVRSRRLPLGVRTDPKDKDKG